MKNDILILPILLSVANVFPAYIYIYINLYRLITFFSTRKINFPYFLERKCFTKDIRFNVI